MQQVASGRGATAGWTAEDAPGDDALEGLPRLDAPALLTGQVADALRRAILAGELRPGTRLSVPRVAAMLGVSRTPAREALLALERDGLVEVSPRRGAVVLQAGLADLLELYDLREALDGMAARLAAERARDEQRARMAELTAAYRVAIERSATDEFVGHDFAFHGALLEATGNRRLQEALGRIHNQVQVVSRALAVQERLPMPLVLADHEAIGEAVAAARATDAEEAARAHVRRVRDEVVAFYGEPVPRAE